MKRRNTYIIVIAIILLIIVVPLGINRIYSTILDKTYPNLASFSGGNSYRFKKVPFTGRLQFQFFRSFDDNYASPIYMDTIKLNFRVITKTYVGVDNNEETAYTTFDRRGKILETDRYIPKETDNTYQLDRETLNGDGKVIQKAENVKDNEADHLQNCILLKGELPPWPKWKNRSSLIYINHFSKKELHLSKLNPFRLGGINGDKNHRIWDGFAYCDIQFMGKIIKIKIPFGYDSFFLNTDEYDADLQYYTLPKQFLKTLPIRFIQLKDDVYIVMSI